MHSYKRSPEGRFLIRKPMRITQYLKETRAEMANIKWPTRKDTTIHTALVIVISVIVGLALSGLDLGFARAVRELISAFSI
jgi:preprotein translocase SecE subunit